MWAADAPYPPSTPNFLGRITSRTSGRAAATGGKSSGDATSVEGDVVLASASVSSVGASVEAGDVPAEAAVEEGGRRPRGDESVEVRRPVGPFAARHLARASVTSEGAGALHFASWWRPSRTPWHDDRGTTEGGPRRRRGATEAATRRGKARRGQLFDPAVRRTSVAATGDARAAGSVVRRRRKVKRRGKS